MNQTSVSRIVLNEENPLRILSALVITFLQTAATGSVVRRFSASSCNWLAVKNRKPPHNTIVRRSVEDSYPGLYVGLRGRGDASTRSEPLCQSLHLQCRRWKEPRALATEEGGQFRMLRPSAAFRGRISIC